MARHGRRVWRHLGDPEGRRQVEVWPPLLIDRSLLAPRRRRRHRRRRFHFSAADLRTPPQKNNLSRFTICFSTAIVVETNRRVKRSTGVTLRACLPPNRMEESEPSFSPTSTGKNKSQLFPFRCCCYTDAHARAQNALHRHRNRHRLR